MSNRAVNPWSPGWLLLEEYRVEWPLGEGGMGLVYLVQSRSTGERFAVKRARPGTSAGRGRLLSELQTWIDLPEHLHLTACRFFRTAGDEVVLFAEYVEGGCLAEWVQQRRLTAIDQVLDVAIQLARGLHAAHEHGVVHQDVKPGNVLLALDGLVKVTDFGLARMRAGGREGVSGAAPFGGALTRQYCSPEQAHLLAHSVAEARLTPQTDIWSWGVTVLEMFVGEPPCRYGGHLAAEVLESFLRQPVETGLPPLPELLAVILRQCFQRRPADRWASMAEVASAVQVVYQVATGQLYPRPEPTPAAGRGPLAERSRRTFGGCGWDDPCIWLRPALRAAGRDPNEVDSFVPQRTGSRKARAIADLVPYDAAHRLLAPLVAGGRRDLAELLAKLDLAKAVVHEAADDPPGTANLCAEAAALLEPLVAGGRADLAGDLIESYRNRATVLHNQGRYHDAVELCDRGLAVCAEQGAPRDRRMLGAQFVSCCRDKGQALALLGDYHAALALYERAQVVCEALIRHDGRDDCRRQLAGLYVSKARALQALGELSAAAAWLDQALPVYERLIEEDSDRGLIYALGSTCLTKADLLGDLRDPGSALALYDRVIARWQRLAEEEDWPDLSSALARAYGNKAILLSQQGQHAESLRLYDQALAIYQRLSGPGGQQELVPTLARTCLNKALALCACDDPTAALELGSRALALMEPLVVCEGRRDLAPDLAWAHRTQARTFQALGQLEAALACAQAATVLYEQLLHQQGRWELGADLLRTYRTQAAVLADMGRAALELLDRAVMLGEQLLNDKGQQELRGDVARLRIDRAAVLTELGQVERARAELCDVMIMLESQDDLEDVRQIALRRLERLW